MIAVAAGEPQPRGMGVGDRVDDVTDVEFAPTATQRLLIGTPVAGRAAVIRNQHVPPLRTPEGDARHEGDLPLIGRSAVQPAQQPIGRTVRVIQAGVERATIGGSELHQVGLGQW